MLIGIKSIGIFLGILLGSWIGVQYLLPLCFPFLLGTGLALLAEPVVGLLCRRLKLPRGVGAGIGVTAAFLTAAMLILILGAVLLRELTALAGILPDLTDTARSGLSLLQNWLLTLAARTPDSIQPLLQQNVQELFTGGSALLDRAFQHALGLAGDVLTHVPDSALSLGTAVISGFMISARLPEIRQWLRIRFPREKWKKFTQTIKQIQQTVGGWLLAQLKLAGVTMGILAAGLMILRVPYGLLWALAISLVDAVPVLGTGTVLLPWALICFLQLDKARAVGLLGIYCVIVLIRSVLEPKFLGKQLGLDPLVTLFFMYAGYRLWGIGGMILSPLLAVTMVQLLPGRG